MVLPQPAAAPRPSRRAVLGAALAGATAATLPTRAAVAASTPDAVPHLVIGSGYGGAVLARRLTEAGQPVLMLEMGQDWTAPGPDGRVFTPIRQPDARSMWFRDRTAVPVQQFLGIPIDQTIPRGPGVLDRVEFAQMSVYAGRGVGGGSLVNGAMAVTPPRALVEERLAVDPATFYDTYLPRARAELGVRDHDPAFVASSDFYQFARVGKAAAERTGYSVVGVPTVYDPDYLKAEAAGTAPGSATAGEVIFGNNHGKADLTKTYLARARATGLLTIRPMTAATLLRRSPQGGLLVDVEQVNADGTRMPLPAIAAQRVYLGAGSLGTTGLLLRSKAHGLEVPDAVGTGWGPNGNVMVGRANHVWDPTGTKQSTIPVYGIDGWTGRAREDRVFAEIAPMPAGIETWVSLYLAITDNPARGTFAWDTAADRLTLDWGPTHAAAGIAAAKRLFDRINARHSTVYRSDLFGGGKVFGADFTYHPLGGAVLGEATDRVGRLLGQSDLFVTDGSLVPGVLGVNPFVTITALAELVAENAVRTA